MSPTPTPATPKITLEFSLTPFHLVRSCYERHNAPPLRMSNDPARDRSKEKDLKWNKSKVPEGLAAYVFAFVRARRFFLEGKAVDDAWPVLVGGKGSAAHKLGRVHAQTNIASYQWVEEFCGCTGDGRAARCGLNPFFCVTGLKAATEVTVQLDATMFPPANIIIKVCGKKSATEATPVQLLNIEKQLDALKIWKSPDALAKHIPSSLGEPAVKRSSVKGVPERNPPPEPEAFRAYRTHVAQQFGEVQEASLRFLSGTGAAGGEAKPPRLAEVYVKLDTEPAPITDREGRRNPLMTIDEVLGRTDSEIMKEKDRVPAIKRLIDLLGEQGAQGAGRRNLVLLGGPGSGKSTFLRHVALALAQHALAPRDGWLERLNSKLPTHEKDSPVHSWPKDQGELIPIFVELRKFADDLAQKAPKSSEADCERLWAFIAAELAKSDLRDSVPALKSAASSGHAIVFFDGLDEVPTDTLKRFMVNTVSKFARLHLRTPVVVTCRVVSYADEAWHLPGFASATLSALDEPRRRLFIERFYRELTARGRTEADGRIASLTQAVETRPELREMAGTPYLLSMMCQLHLRTKLPGERAALFEKFVEELLFDLEVNRRRDEKGPPTPTLKVMLEQAEVSPDRFRGVLSRLAFLAHRAGQQRSDGGTGPAAGVIAEQDLKDALARLPHQRFSKTEREDWATRVVRLIEERSGILEARAQHQFAMAFKLQEFMAASHLTLPDELEITHPDSHDFEVVTAGLIQDDSGYWEEVVKLAAGIHAHVRKNSSAARGLAATLCDLSAPSDAARVRRAKIAGEILCDIGINNVGSSPTGLRCLATIRTTLKTLAADSNLPIVKRSEAASAFGWLEALPAGVGLAEGDPLRPHIVWCGAAGEFREGDAAGDWKAKLFPAHTGMPEAKRGKKAGRTKAETVGNGKIFLIGEPPDRPEAERAWNSFRQFPCTRITAPFFIAKYPVTVAQYAAFEQAGGYEDKGTEEHTKRLLQWWTEAGLKWKRSENITGPEPGGTVFETPNHPRTGVSWYEARAFCAWLNSEEIKPRMLEDWGLSPANSGAKAKTKGEGWTIRLPSEAEWELAARWNKDAQVPGADDRRVPWGGPGDETDLAVHGNCDFTGIGSTSAVGIFPGSRDDCGAADLIGNVWEWCATKWVANVVDSDEKEGNTMTPEKYNMENNQLDDDAGDSTRVLRGGSWIGGDPRYLRSALRGGVDPGGRRGNVGFRVVCVLVGSAGG